MRRVVLTLLLLWCLLATALALRPFSFDWSCHVCRNGAVISAIDGRLEFPTHGMARTRVSPAFNESLMEAGALEIEAMITPYNTWQAGPARILSYSAGPRRWNFMLGQRSASLVFRFRTNDAEAPRGIAELYVRNVFSENQPVHVVVNHDAGGTVITIDGVEALRVDSPRMDVATWKPDYLLLIGNEVSGNRTWLGSVERLVVRAGADGPLLADFDFTGAADALPEGVVGASDLVFPAVFLGFGLHDETFGMESFLLHIGMLLPVGFLVPFLLSTDRSGASRFALTMVVVIAYALAVELAQHFTTNRTTSVLDFLTGLVGGGIGYAGYVMAKARMRRRRPRGHT